MKNLKLLSIFLVLLFINNLNAQDSETSEIASDTSGFKKWSLEVQAGVSGVSSNIATDDYYVNPFAFSHANVGVRYMFNSLLGLKLNVASTTDLKVVKMAI